MPAGQSYLHAFFLAVFIVAAYALLQSPSTAEMTNRVSMPSTFHTHPPNSAMKIVMRWFTEIPVEIVARISSFESEISCTYTLDAIEASDITESST